MPLLWRSGKSRSGDAASNNFRSHINTNRAERIGEMMDEMERAEKGGGGEKNRAGEGDAVPGLFLLIPRCGGVRDGKNGEEKRREGKKESRTLLLCGEGSGRKILFGRSD